MRKRRDLGQPSDIAFLLIIFFLLLAGINTSQSIALRLGTESQKQEVPLHALLTQQGTILLDDQFYSPFEFALKLVPNTTLHLQVEEATSWQQVVDLLSLTEQRQIAGLSLTLADDATTAISSKSEGEPIRETHMSNLQENSKQAERQKDKLLKEEDEVDEGNTRVMAP